MSRVRNENFLCHAAEQRTRIMLFNGTETTIVGVTSNRQRIRAEDEHGKRRTFAIEALVWVDGEMRDDQLDVLTVDKHGVIKQIVLEDGHNADARIDQICTDHCGGLVDIGSARPFQYAVHEWSHGTALNQTATNMLGRPVYGPVVIWGNGPGGHSTGYSQARTEVMA